MNIHSIENRVEELMQEGKASKLRGWSAREISERITSEWRDEKAGQYAFRYIAYNYSTAKEGEIK
tara:strand:+ start:36 stop:230 length:195 start_codon:yes stop_codon:yes gene_type:complete